MLSCLEDGELPHSPSMPSGQGGTHVVLEEEGDESWPPALPPWSGSASGGWLFGLQPLLLLLIGVEKHWCCLPIWLAGRNLR